MSDEGDFLNDECNSIREFLDQVMSELA